MIKRFFKDYVALCKESGKFMKKHWLGLIITYLVIFGMELGWFYRDEIKEKILECKLFKKLNERKQKKEEEELERMLS